VHPRFDHVHSPCGKAEMLVAHCQHTRSLLGFLRVRSGRDTPSGLNVGLNHAEFNGATMRPLQNHPMSRLGITS
jgi:hypothetical protein